MELSNDLIKIILVLYPGIISMIVLERLITNTKIEFNRYLVYIVVLSISSYAVAYLLWGIYSFLCSEDGSVQPSFILIDLLKNSNSFDIKNLFYVTIVSLLLSFILSFVINRKLLNKFGQKLGLTNKYGDESVWDYFHNKDNVEWVTIRDKNKDLMYVCWIEVYSDDGTEYDELLLRDIIVYKNSTAEKQYEVDEMYLSSRRENLTIEIFNYKEENNE
jgi:hypothetical protein